METTEMFETVGKEIDFSQDTQKLLEQLQSQRPDIDTEENLKFIDISGHDVNQLDKRPNKMVKTDEGGKTVSKIVEVARIPLALQKLIIKRAVAFLFGNPVNWDADVEEGNSGQELLWGAFNEVLHDNKTEAKDRQIAWNISALQECAELWYAQEKKHDEYGFNSDFRLRCMILTPDKNTFYPYFNEYEDLIAFSRKFKKGKMQYFETWTADEQYLFVEEKKGRWKLEDGYPKMNPIGKIPIVYGSSPETETADVNALISRLEKLLSNFADTNDYHASPKIKVVGKLLGFAQKGEPGGILELEQGSDANYMAWANAPESVRLEIETLLRMIYGISQTPDFSFDTLRGVGVASGRALELLSTDAFLKAADKTGFYIEYLTRRANIIQAFLQKFNISLTQKLRIKPEITPYRLTSEEDELNYWMTATGHKPLVSQKTAMEKIRLTQNAEEDYERLKEEESRLNTFDFAGFTEA